MNLRTIAVAILVTGSVSTAALAHKNATGVVKERMDLMGVLKESMKSLSDMMRGKTDMDTAAIKSHAKTIAEHGGDKLIKLFPEDSIMPPSEALQSIWQKKDEFEHLANLMRDYALALEKAADNDSGPMHGQSGMMGQGMMQGQGMMDGKKGMMGQHGGMMGNQGPDPDHLASMPPQAAFNHLAQTCASCHEQFREKKH